MGIKVLLVDDHLMVLKGLRFFLGTQPDIELVGEASNGKEAVELVGQLQPDVILMDLTMPVMDGIEATKQIKENHDTVKIIVLTSFSDQDHVVPALQAGADGYQMKDIEPDELVKSIKAVQAGETHLHPSATSQLLNHVNTGSKTNEAEQSFNQLTAREKDVLKQITLGRNNKEISSELFITEKTVKTHVSNILGKLGLQDRTQAAILAMRNKWFDV
ncbi:response regulator [Pseudalkalibacillus berkeleyi]|uniref:Response regulator transcription factor n=1 Tax=Pseudalkalibacillus berkeleyi TaxID=1069813 RepID=A0ABS9H471_9BACL|nr:response regulator transcription factor [Pseudalkalibacillus berkeleyi]MCF6138593.1 response regulator transcription factor [Pseudalkalibacillus berkeleyi]